VSDAAVQVPEQIATRQAPDPGAGDTAPQRSIELEFAIVFAGEIRRRSSAGHFAFELLKSPLCLALAIVDQSYGCVCGHWRAANGYGVADCLIDVVFAILPAADRPFEADCRDRAGPVLE
jgi:hypothetical protein